MKSEAILSVDRKYRYVLTRTWDETLLNIMFVGLNPSTADETTDDPTIQLGVVSTLLNHGDMVGYIWLIFLLIVALIPTIYE